MSDKLARVGQHKWIGSNATTVVKASPGVLHRVVINCANLANDVSIYDDRAAANAANTIAVIAKGVSGSAMSQRSVEFGCVFRYGLVVVTVADADDITIVYE